jgi:hypothetical protein
MGRLDFNKVFILHTNWNARGIGVILGQLDEEDKEYVIAYASRSNNKAKSNYSSYEGGVLLLYGSSYISGLIFMALSSFCISTTSLSNG